MFDQFFEKPILNSPYDYPERHWELDDSGQPTQMIVEQRRVAEFVTPIPKPRRRRSRGEQDELVFGDGQGLSSQGQQYDVTGNVNEIRRLVDAWRQIPNPSDWGVTPETQRLLQHWRSHEFSSYRPFFCQVEAAETVIWLTEVAPRLRDTGRDRLEYLANASRDANPELVRWALKMATGAGKTTVMAMLIAWQTVNAVRHPRSNRFTRGFLVVAPGITIKDRLRVLQPNDPDSYYQERELVPDDMLPDLERAKIVVTNYHAFMLRETMNLSRGNRDLLEGHDHKMETLETEGQMVKRVMPELMGLRNVMVLNDEGHHCYRAKPAEQSDEGNLTGDDRSEAKKNNDEARVWISGLEIVKRVIGISNIIDLSATPFFLRGSGYAEGTLFPWTVTDFSLMDAIECGIVKLPRVPVADNIPETDMPTFRVLWEHIRPDMPRAGRRNSNDLDPLSLPVTLQTALDALYGHYERTFEEWQKAGISTPPCFIVVCNNTASSKLVHDYISGFEREDADGNRRFVNGRLRLFRNFDDSGNRLPTSNTILIDSAQLESGEGLDRNFRQSAADEIERFKQEKIVREGDRMAAENITDAELLREVMNTVGKEGQLGGNVRCVVSVSMLTEGWDANTVTHILGVRAFGTQLLCEQVIGRALRRQSYDLNDENLFDVEYADVLGVPFDFTAKPVVAPPPRPKKTYHVKAVRPERDDLEITFPRVTGYRVEPPTEKLTAKFTDDSLLNLTPDLVGPTITRNEGIIGEGVDLNLVHTKKVRQSTIEFTLAKHLLETRWRDDDGLPRLHFFGQLKQIVGDWLDSELYCDGGTYPAQLLYTSLAERACDRIDAAINLAHVGENPVKAVLDAYNPVGSTRHVNFTTSKGDVWTTDSRRCHVNYAVLDSGWEGEFCRAVEAHSKTRAYVKNHNLGFGVPYRRGGEPKTYRPDYIVLIDDGEDEPLRLVVEIKGYRNEDVRDKNNAMVSYWLPGVNALGRFGRWAFAEFKDEHKIADDFERYVDSLIRPKEAEMDVSMVPPALYAARLRSIREEAEDHDIEVNNASVADFISLLHEIPDARPAELFFTDEGDLSAEWRTGPESHFELQFLGDGTVHYAIFAGNDETDDVVQHHGTTGLPEVPGLVSRTGMQSVVCW